MQQVEHTPRKYPRRSMFTLGARAVAGVLAGSSVLEAADLISHPTKHRIADSSYFRRQDLALGDHFVFLPEVKEWFSDSDHGVLSGEVWTITIFEMVDLLKRTGDKKIEDLGPEDMLTPLQLEVLQKTKQDISLLEALSGSGGTFEQRVEDRKALAWMLKHGHTIISADFFLAGAPWARHFEYIAHLHETNKHSKMHEALLSLIATAYVGIEGLDATFSRLQKKLNTNETLPAQQTSQLSGERVHPSLISRLFNRRTFFKIGATSAIAAGGLVTSFLFRRGIKTYRTQSNPVFSRFNVVLHELKNELQGMVYGEEVELIERILIPQRSMAMLRNTQVGVRQVEQHSPFDGSETADLVLMAGAGHSNLRAYLEGTDEELDDSMRKTAEELISYYHHQLMLPQEQRVDQSTDTSVLLRFSALALIGFSFPAVVGEKMNRKFRAVAGTELKSPETLLIEIVQAHIDTSTGKDQEGYITLLNQFCMSTQERFLELSGRIPTQGVVRMDTSDFRIQEEIDKGRFTVLPHWQGKSIEELVSQLEEKASDVVPRWSLPYATISQDGITYFVLLEKNVPDVVLDPAQVPQDLYFFTLTYTLKDAFGSGNAVKIEEVLQKPKS